MTIHRSLRALMLLVLGTMPIFLYACGDSGSQTTSGPTTISFWVRSADEGFVKPVVAAYNASHKNKVNLTIVPNNQFVAKFGSAVSGGTAPDVIAIDLVYMPNFDAAGQMTDITDQAKALSFFKDLSPSHVRLSTYDGKIYALPFSAESSVLIYNKALFKKAGLNPDTPPKTWAEIEQDAAKIRALGKDTYGFYFSGGCGGCNIFTFAPYFWASGGDILNQDGTKATIASSPQVKDALEFYHRMWAAGDMPAGAKSDDGTNFLNTFTTGKIGIQGTGAFAIGSLKSTYPNLDFGVAPLPGKDGGNSSFAGGDVIGIPKGSAHAKEAFDFISWCLGSDVQVDQFAKNGSIPVRTDLAANKYSKLDPRYSIVSQQLVIGKTVYSVKENELINDNNGPWVAMIQKAVFDGKVDEAIATGQAQFTQILSAS
ncbi:ABC transporter substrate-binding protein [Reticulibacter mediterranei]|nr:sugar ABC transporter substrate-binding protein [Reticulibacter mediterranei]